MGPSTGAGTGDVQGMSPCCLKPEPCDGPARIIGLRDVRAARVVPVAFGCDLWEGDNR